MVGYAEMFERVARFVESQGIKAQFERGGPLTDRAIVSARKQLPIPLPECLVELYRELGDGFSFRWSDGKLVPPAPEQQRIAAQIGELTGRPFEHPWIDGGKVFAVIEFSPLSELVAHHLERTRGAIEYDTDYEFSHVKDRQLAGKTAQWMKHWLGFHNEGNGDRFCIDTSTEPHSVVLDQHDWFDGATGANGTVLARTLPEFLEQWSRVCFQSPNSLWWWPTVLTESGVNWDGEEFDQRFRLPVGRI
jgi:SMI1 / KNR4 family (SUKH-1)